MLFEPGRVQIHKRKRLPHWDAQHGTQFVTFNTATIVFDATLAAFVAETLEYHDKQRYELLAWCVMPDHTHVILRTKKQLASLVQTWKSFSAHRINDALHRTGRVWSEEYFDRLMRSEDELTKAVRYVLDNPVKSELFGWPHVRCYPERL